MCVFHAEFVLVQFMVLKAIIFSLNKKADGIMCSFGVIYTQLLDEFKEGKAYTSWIMSVMSGMALCAGNAIHINCTTIQEMISKFLVSFT